MLNSVMSPSRGLLDISTMVEEISTFVESQPDDVYSLVIGSDSQEKRLKGRSEYDFVTAIVIHRHGNGAKFYYIHGKVKGKMVLRDRMYAETTRSLQVAQELVPVIRKKLNGANYDLEIHVDVGQFGKTRDMINEVTGMVAGSGYKVKTKPNSWAASSVADRFA